MNNYRKKMNELPFDPAFKQKTVALMRSRVATVSPQETSGFKSGWMRVALIAATLTATLTLVAFAAVKLLTPSEVAEFFGDTALSVAFEEDSAVIVNEEQTVGDYTITLHGVVGGEDVADYVENRESRYIVLSVRYTDGRAIQTGDTWEDDPICRFTASPYVHGHTPDSVNLYTLESRASKGVVDNVLYILMETDTLGAFDNVPLYLGVVESNRPAHIYNDTQSPFTMNENGAIVCKDGYEGDMAYTVFTLPNLK